MLDRQLQLLTEVLKKGRIWALNIGENMNISKAAWERFTAELQHTRVSFMYVSEHHLVRTDLKQRMMDAIRENRRLGSTLLTPLPPYTSSIPLRRTSFLGSGAFECRMMNGFVCALLQDSDWRGPSQEAL